MSKYKLITLSNPKSPASEAFRTLRTNIMFTDVDRPLKTIVFTSSSPGEGKSTIAANYAVTLTQAGYNVLLVDCDMRNPTIHKIFGLKNDTGLTNILVGLTPFQKAIHTGWVERLNIITTGPIPPNPAELIGSPKMDKFIEDISQKAGIVLFDAPPVVPVTDAQLLASKVDGVIMVVDVGAISKEMANKAKELINNVNGRILGCVMNRVDYENQSHYYYNK